MGKIEYPGRMTKFLYDYYGDQPLVGAEIGVLNGDHALELLQSLKIETLYLIDPYTAYDEYRDENRPGLRDALHIAIHKLAPFSGQIKWLFLQSSEALKFINQLLHFFYADGNHAKNYIHSDLWNYMPIIADNGVFGGHDYYTRKDPDNLCEVQEVVDEFAELSGIPLYLDSSYEYDWPDWWFIKTPEMVDRLALEGIKLRNSPSEEKKFVYKLWEEDTKFP